jgi:sortase A
MTLLVSKKSVQWALRWMQRVLLAGAVAMLGWCGFVMGEAWIFQKQERRQLEQWLADPKTVGARPTLASISLKPSPPLAIGSLIGRLEISRLGVSAMLIEGVSRTNLRRAIGHIPGTAVPGQPGNVGISGHRDTFFRPLRNIRENDIIIVTTPVSAYRYRVVSTRIVSPDDVAVLNPGETEVLTLVTCYPFYFVGAAPDRFVVRAQRIQDPS